MANIKIIDLHKNNKKFVWIFSILLIISGVSFIPLAISAMHCSVVLQNPACGIGEGFLQIFIVIPLFIISSLALCISYIKRKREQKAILTLHKIILLIAVILLIINVGYLLFYNNYFYPTFLSPLISIKSCNEQKTSCGYVVIARPKMGCEYTSFPDEPGQPVRCLFGVS